MYCQVGTTNLTAWPSHEWVDFEFTECLPAHSLYTILISFYQKLIIPWYELQLSCDGCSYKELLSQAEAFRVDGKKEMENLKFTSKRVWREEIEKIVKKSHVNRCDEKIPLNFKVWIPNFESLSREIICGLSNFI